MVLNHNSELNAYFKEAVIMTYLNNEYKPIQNLIKVVL